MMEIFINIKDEFKRGIIAPALPGVIPSIFLAIHGQYASAYFLELLSFSTIYSALFLKKIWAFKSFWMGIFIISIFDLIFVFNINITGHGIPFFAFTPLAILYCVGLVYGLCRLVSWVSGVEIFFVE